MHVLILNHHPLQTQFLQKALRYENIGADMCHPENLLKTWYGQYDALIVPLSSWDHPPFLELTQQLKELGKVPTLITSRHFPPAQLSHEFQTNPYLRFVGSYERNRSLPRLT